MTVSLCPEGAECNSPGQSEAPPWVISPPKKLPPCKGKASCVRNKCRIKQRLCAATNVNPDCYKRRDTIALPLQGGIMWVGSYTQGGTALCPGLLCDALSGRRNTAITLRYIKLATRCDAKLFSCDMQNANC